jgi:hypothetical protein
VSVRVQDGVCGLAAPAFSPAIRKQSCAAGKRVIEKLFAFALVAVRNAAQ